MQLHAWLTYAATMIVCTKKHFDRREGFWPSLYGKSPLEKQVHAEPCSAGGDGVRVQPQL